MHIQKTSPHEGPKTGKLNKLIIKLIITELNPNKIYIQIYSQHEQKMTFTDFD